MGDIMASVCLLIYARILLSTSCSMCRVCIAINCELLSCSDWAHFSLGTCTTTVDLDPGETNSEMDSVQFISPWVAAFYIYIYIYWEKYMRPFYKTDLFECKQNIKMHSNCHMRCNNKHTVVTSATCNLYNLYHHTICTAIVIHILVNSYSPHLLLGIHMLDKCVSLKQKKKSSRINLCYSELYEFWLQIFILTSVWQQKVEYA